MSPELHELWFYHCSNRCCAVLKTAQPACLFINQQATLSSTCHRHSSMQREILETREQIRFKIALKISVCTGHFLEKTIFYKFHKETTQKCLFFLLAISLTCLIQNNNYLYFLNLFSSFSISSLFFAGRPWLILWFQSFFCWFPTSGLPHFTGRCVAAFHYL